MGTQHTDALLRFVRRWFDERTVTNVFEPLLADHQREWLDAPSARRARIAVRTAMAFIVAMLSVAPRALVLAPAPASMTRRVVARMIIFISIVSATMLVPFLIQLPEVPPDRLVWVLMWLLPSQVLVAFPFAIGFVVDGVRRHSRPTPAERLALVRTAVVAVAAMLVLHGWIVPATNQQFRTTVMADAARPPARGVRELTTTQLIQSPWQARAEGFQRVEAIQRELHNRASLAVLPVILIWLRWRALHKRSPQWRLPAWLAATLTFITFGVVRSNEVAIESALGLDPGLGAWAPLVVFVIAGLARDYVVRAFNPGSADASPA